MKIAVSILCLLLCMPVVLRACDSCAIYTATEAQGKAGSGLFAGISEQFTHYGSVQVDGHKEDNEVGQYMDSSITQVFLGYHFNDRFTLQANIPLIYRSYKRPEGFEIERGNVAGPGDASLVGNFQLYKYESADITYTLNVLGGVKFPTGSASRIREEFNEVDVPGAPESGIHGHDLALGSGSFDGIVGFSDYFRYQRFFATAQLQYLIRTEGQYGYQYANEVDWSAGPGIYVLLEHEYTLALQLVASGDQKDTDTFQGESEDDTGMTSVYLGPQVTGTVGANLSADVGIDIPVLLDNTSFQAVPDYRIHAGMTWHF